MATPKIAIIYVDLEGHGANDVRVRLNVKLEDKNVTKDRALVVGFPCFLESQLAFLPKDLREYLINETGGFIMAYKDNRGLLEASQVPSEKAIILPPIADFTIEVHNAPRGPVATVDSRFWKDFNKSAAMSLALFNTLIQSFHLLARDEFVRLLILLEIGVRMWTEKKPSRTLYLTGASVYNRPNWSVFQELSRHLGWEEGNHLFSNSFEEFLYMK